MQTETRAYIITMTINTAHASIYATAWTGSFAFYFLYKAVHAVGQEFPSSREVIQAGQDYSTKWNDFAGCQRCPQLPHPEPPQYRASTPTACLQPYSLQGKR